MKTIGYLEQKRKFPNVVLEDRTGEIGMMSFQGPATKTILERILSVEFGRGQTTFCVVALG